jgi:Glycosyltransferases involved in cell wall biogenesis
MKNKIVVLVPFYNVASYIVECFDSLISQEYPNFEIHFIDDCSEDGTLDLIPDNLSNVIKRKNPSRLLALESIYRTLTNIQFDDEDIIVFVDGDDYLIDKQVFNKLSEIYEQKGCLLTYGQYKTINSYEGHCYAYSKEEFENLRTLDWRASHLKSFKYKLFKEFLNQDPLVFAYKDAQGGFFPMTYDIAIMNPLMEIAGYDKVYFNPEIFYVYRIHEFNDDKVDGNKQRSIEDEIKGMEKFKTVCFETLAEN